VLDVADSLAATYPLVRLPTAERPERALFISLAAVALQAVHDAEMKLGDAVSVHGLGTIGLLTVQMCRLEGIQNVFAVDPDPARRKLAANLGASHVLDPTDEPAVGPPDPRAEHGPRRGRGSRGLRQRPGPPGRPGGGRAGGDGGGGRLLPGRGGQRAPGRGVPPQPAVADRLDGRLGRAAPDFPLWDRRRVMATATRLLYTDRVSVEGLLGRRFPFDQAPAAYRWIDQHPQAAVKVALTYG
jgi:threonine dehydrogenase-like Zn-dependent dehydrogenase